MAPILVLVRQLRDAVKQRLGEEALLWLTLFGVLLGLCVGAVARTLEASARSVELLGLPGELLLRALKALVLPLIALSMVSGVVSLRRQNAGRTASVTLYFYALSACASVTLAVLLVSAIRPGAGRTLGARCAEVQPTLVQSNATDGGPGHSGEDATVALDSLLNALRGAVPSNVIAAAAEGNTLGIITVSLAFGAALAATPGCEQAIELMISLNGATQTIVSWALRWMPLGVGSLVAGKVAEACDPIGALQTLGMFVFCVLAGLVVQTGALTLAYMVQSKRSPRRLLKSSSPALAAVLGTSSSTAALPVTLRCAQSLGIDKAVADFCLPLGATVNMNGTAMYEAITVVTIAQVHGIELGVGGTLAVMAT
eukprot:CAMPEP_0183809896 /NCGR_PEP_ID=MMETSP0803_2-20130417/46313_1 /TAXON_ID=195967 /ORGANISM="Crustomastix stigmata, Strain CCMP3273" /LENGTH=369 /DNA_ID=CAMNT_0026054703 /DNA_START=24 /DNA_END=1129 /DNA_ORIENTATION=-